MYYLGSRSMRHLNTCDVIWLDLCRDLIKEIDFAVIEGHRNKAQQNAYYAKGRTEPGNIITYVKWPNGDHNVYPSRALHLIPWPFNGKKDWTNSKRFYHLAGVVRGVAYKRGVKVRWGGNWDGDSDLDDQTFNDLLHYELKRM